MTAKLCRLAIWHRCTLTGSQSHQMNRARRAHHHGEEMVACIVG